ncbi:MAG TPA: AEC family transporter, partial [Dehalococcoidia bacterium]
CYYGGRALGLTVGTGLRTFALVTGICNYGYLPLPIMGAMWGHDILGVLLVYNIGVGVALWTVGVLVLSGLSPRDGWRKLVNPTVVTMAVAVALNGAGLAGAVPAAVTSMTHALAECAIPLGLVMIGVSLANYLGDLLALLKPRVTLGSCLLRLGVLPIAILCVARWLPCSVELKRVLVVQAAMPAGVFTIVLARHYGGQPLTAVQIVFGTTVLGIFMIPWWIQFGLGWLGV